VPPFEAKAGDRVELDLACIWTVRDGKLVEYHDYG
jgi:ketosteroid isomerase-like protein